MASLMDNLVEVLEEENSQYEVLIALGNEKRKAIVGGEIVTLESITDKEQDVASLLRNLDNKRDAILKDMADVLGKNFEEMTITKLIGYLSKQPNEQERLSKIRSKILDTGKKMQECNLRNEKLLKQALEMVEFDLTLFKSMRQAPETANYNKNAYNTGDILPSSGFDAKQ